MRPLRIGIALAVVFGLVALTSVIMGWPLEKTIYLAPVIVVATAALAGLLILWGKVAVQSLRESRRPRLVLGLWVGGIALLVLLSVLGVELPREGGKNRSERAYLRVLRLVYGLGGRKMKKSQRVVLVVSALVVAFAAGIAAPGRATGAPAPGPWCGGTLWKLMTLSDPGRVTVKWPGAATTVADIGKIKEPAPTPTRRSTAFQKQNWELTGRRRSLAHGVERRDRARALRRSVLDLHGRVHPRVGLPLDRRRAAGRRSWRPGTRSSPPASSRRRPGSSSARP